MRLLHLFVATAATATAQFDLQVVVGDTVRPAGSSYDLGSVYTNESATARFRLGRYSSTADCHRQGHAADILIDVLRVSGLNDPITVTLSGLPTGTSVSYSENPVPFSRTVVTLSVPSSAAPGSYSVTATGTAAGITHSITFTLDVS